MRQNLRMADLVLDFPIRSDKLRMSVQASELICRFQSNFQAIDIYQTEMFGKVLMLDGHIQLTEFDERAYHESLVQIPLLSIEGPKTALVVGGGDGRFARALQAHFDRADRHGRNRCRGCRGEPTLYAGAERRRVRRSARESVYPGRFSFPQGKHPAGSTI